MLKSQTTVEEYNTVTVKEDEEADLALLKVDGVLQLQTYKAKIAVRIREGDQVVGIGFPKGEKKYFLAKVTDTQKNLTLLDIVIIGGNSGGGVYFVNQGGLELAGIVIYYRGMTPLPVLRKFLQGTVLEDDYVL